MPTMKLFHVTFVTLSISGFFIRGLLMLYAPDRLKGRIVRTVPHVNDTLLLATGVAMLVGYGWNPLHQPWLLTKLLALMVHIVLGALALGHWGLHGRGPRAAAWVASMLVFGYIVLVALYKTPQVWLVL
jgi:uncharacterized membrane protein SirB2